MYKIESFINSLGHDVNVYIDEYPESPREWDNMWQWVSNHRRIDLNESPFDLDYVAEHHDELSEQYIIVPVYMYDHSGIALSLESFVGRTPHAEWDSGVGFFAMVSKKRLRNEYGVEQVTGDAIERAINVLRGEIETYGAYLNGEVYGWVETDENSDDVDSCWGYYGESGLEQIKNEHCSPVKAIEPVMA
jgi:hypothetical protein